MAIVMDYLFSLFLFSLLFVKATSTTCSWSNEHCSRDKECCSGSCYRAFEGTNPRCRHSALSEKCIFSFHCADDLECGPKFNCCSPYWKMCTKTSDCCDPMHICKPADGFYYKRCLYPSAATPSILPPSSRHPGTTFLLLLLQTAFVYICTVFNTAPSTSSQSWCDVIVKR